MIDETIAKVGFVHLHVHTAFSLREGAIPLGKLLKLAMADEMPAVAVTDVNNLFGALELSEKFAKDGVQPIAGCQLTVEFGDAEALRSRGEILATDAGRGNIVLLAQTEQGYLQPDASHVAGLAGDRRRAIRRMSASAQLAARERGADRAERRPERPARPRLRAGQGRSVACAAAGALWSRCFRRRLYIELQRHGLESEQRGRAAR